jgi:hypothetical protein
MTVVMGHVLAEHQGQATLIDDQDPVQQLPAACRISHTVDAAIGCPSRASGSCLVLVLARHLAARESNRMM